MDIATVVGLILGIGLILGAIVVGSPLIIFIDIPSVLIVGGGVFATLLIQFPLSCVMNMLAVLKNALFVKAISPLDTVSTLVSFAERARREGILALEGSMDEIEDEFIQSGLRLAVDGVEPELIKDILQTELAFIEDRHKLGSSMWGFIGASGPAMGMLGTLIGLVQMLQNLSDPSSIGPSMAVALLTTFYGALMANVIAIPIEGKLKIRSAEEILIKEVAIEGVMSIQSGDNPRILEQKLLAFLAPNIRPPKED